MHLSAPVVWFASWSSPAPHPSFHLPVSVLTPLTSRRQDMLHQWLSVPSTFYIFLWVLFCIQELCLPFRTSLDLVSSFSYCLLSFIITIKCLGKGVVVVAPISVGDVSKPPAFHLLVTSLEVNSDTLLTRVTFLLLASLACCGSGLSRLFPSLKCPLPFFLTVFLLLLVFILCILYLHGFMILL